MDELTSNERRAYEAICELRDEPVVTFDQIAERAGLKRTSAVNATKALEARGIVQAEFVKGRRYRVKPLPIRPQ